LEFENLAHLKNEWGSARVLAFISSNGVAMNDSLATPASLIVDADAQLLYQAKNSGRNCVK